MNSMRKYRASMSHAHPSEGSRPGSEGFGHGGCGFTGGGCQISSDPPEISLDLITSHDIFPYFPKKS